jgi:hypothetical protein
VKEPRAFSATALPQRYCRPRHCTHRALLAKSFSFGLFRAIFENYSVRSAQPTTPAHIFLAG